MASAVSNSMASAVGALGGQLTNAAGQTRKVGG